MSATIPTENDIEALIEAVDRADQAGNPAEAERALARARSIAPDHPGVLNAAGMRALVGGDARAARPLLERAAALDARSPLLWVNVALAHRQLADQSAEREALEKALALDPRYFPALLHKARLLETQGKLKAAASMYNAFLACLPRDVQPPASMQPAIQHAHDVLRESARTLEAFLLPRLAPLRARYAGDRLERFDACLELMLGKRPLYRPEPTFMLFPRLPEIEFIDREHYSWLGAFDAATAAIRA